MFMTRKGPSTWNCRNNQGSGPWSHLHTATWIEPLTCLGISPQAWFLRDWQLFLSSHFLLLFPLLSFSLRSCTLAAEFTGHTHTSRQRQAIHLRRVWFWNMFTLCPNHSWRVGEHEANNGYYIIIFRWNHLKTFWYQYNGWNYSLIQVSSRKQQSECRFHLHLSQCCIIHFLLKHLFTNLGNPAAMRSLWEQGQTFLGFQCSQLVPGIPLRFAIYSLRSDKLL